MTAIVLVLMLAQPAAAGQARREPPASDSAERVRRLIGLLRHPDPAVRFDAVGDLSALGPAAAPATLPLAEALDDTDPNVGFWSARTLQLLGPEARDAVPALAQHLQGTNDELRRACASALGAIGKAATPAAPALARLFEDSNPALRDAAGEALVRIGAPPDSAAPFLVSEVGRTWWAAPLLVRIGRPALDLVIPAWRRAQQRHDDSPAGRALEDVLVRIDPARHVELKIAELLESPPNTAERSSSIYGLAAVARGRSAKAAMGALLGAWRENPREVETALVMIGKEVLPLLIQELRDRRHVEAAWAVLRGFAAAATPALLEAFQDPALRPDATRLLARLARIGGDASDEVRKALRTQADWLVPELMREWEGPQSAGALRAIGADAVPYLMLGLRSDSSSHARAALQAMGAVAVPALLEAFQDPALRRDATRLLARLPGIDADTGTWPPGDEVRKALRSQADWLVPELLGDWKSPQSVVALRAIGEDAVPLLIPELRGDSSNQARAALRALGAAAAPALLQALDDPALRREAALLLVRLPDVGAGPPESPRREQVRAALASHADSLVPDLVHGLGARPDSSDAALALGLTGAPAIPALVAHLRERSATRDFALIALRHMHAEAGPAIPDLVELLATTPGDSLRLEAARTLAAIGEAAREPLRRALEDPKPRFPAAVALLQMGGVPLTTLLPILADPPPSKSAGNANDWYAAVGAFKELGPEGTRYLLERASGGDERAAELLAGVISGAAFDLRWARRWGKPDDRARRQAAYDDLARDATPVLSRALDVPATRRAAASALASLGVAAPLETAARSQDDSARADVAGSVAPLAARALPILIPLLADRDPVVRRQAVMSVAGLEEGRLKALPALVEAVRRADDATCSSVSYYAAEAARGMGGLKGDAQSRVAAAIIERLRGSAACATSVRSAVVSLAPESVSPLVGWLRETGADSWTAVSLLAEIGERAAPAATPLAEALTASDLTLRRKAVEALAGIGKGAAPAVPALIRALSDPEVRWTAATALGAVGVAAVPSLVDSLGDAQRRTPAVVALGKVGRPAAAALPALRQLQAVDDPDLRGAVLAAITNITPTAPTRPR